MARVKAHRLTLDLNPDELRALNELVTQESATMAEVMRSALKDRHRAVLKAQLARKDKRGE